jgi:hypothetical protein
VSTFERRWGYLLRVHLFPNLRLVSKRDSFDKFLMTWQMLLSRCWESHTDHLRAGVGEKKKRKQKEKEKEKEGKVMNRKEGRKKRKKGRKEGKEHLLLWSFQFVERSTEPIFC